MGLSSNSFHFLCVYRQRDSMSHRVSLSFIRRHRHQSFRPFFFIPREKKVNISYSIHVKEMLGYYTHSLICIFRAYAGALSNKKPPKKSSPYHNNNNIVHGHQQQDLLFSITQLQMDKTCLLSSLLSILIFVYILVDILWLLDVVVVMLIAQVFLLLHQRCCRRRIYSHRI
jgi:hypothetical protein